MIRIYCNQKVSSLKIILVGLLLQAIIIPNSVLNRGFNLKSISLKPSMTWRLLLERLYLHQTEFNGSDDFA